MAPVSCKTMNAMKETTLNEEDTSKLLAELDTMDLLELSVGAARAVYAMLRNKGYEKDEDPTMLMRMDDSGKLVLSAYTFDKVESGMEVSRIV